MINPFFRNKGPFKINDLLELSNVNNKENFNKAKVLDIKDLISSTNKDISFFHSKKYELLASKTKASFFLTTDSLAHILPKTCKKIIIDNVLIGNNVKIGKKCLIGHNTIIESNVVIGNNCSIGSNVIIRNTIINNSVSILDGCVIGKKGFGFLPNKVKNIRYPHIGIVIIKDNAEIGCGSTIDRGSMSNTIIGKNSYLDNQIHIAHNNKIGDNCIIAGQVGFAGSSTLGNNVMIGGQAGISGHLKIGNNVQIAGGSGVIKNIPDNSRVMGYPAKDLKSFIKDNQ